MVGTKTDHRFRVPPVVLSRLARGGKTTTLSCVVDALQERTSLKTITISFNGQGEAAFQRRQGESQSQAILRLIAAQLVECQPAEAKRLVVDRTYLDDYLGNNIVLVVDELNRLTQGEPPDGEAAALLREMFLDKAGRYLVYSTHVPITVDTAQMSFGSATKDPSDRGIITVNMSLASSVEQLQALPDCSALTAYRAAWFGYIPSLVLTATTEERLTGATPARRFRDTVRRPQQEEQLPLLKLFVAQLLSGEREETLNHYFGAFSSIGADGRVSYPLCYVQEILRILCPDSREVRHMLSILEKLQVSTEQEGTGMDMECTVQMAIVLRCLRAHWHGTDSPFDIVPPNVTPDLIFVRIPARLRNLAAAKSFIDLEINKYSKPTLLYIDSASQRFEGVEGLVVYTNGANNITRFGFQSKAGDDKCVKEISPDLLDCSYLVRGRVKAARPQPSKQKKGWNYMTVAEVVTLIGTSLQLAMPRDMLVDPVKEPKKNETANGKKNRTGKKPNKL